MQASTKRLKCLAEPGKRLLWLFSNYCGSRFRFFSSNSSKLGSLTCAFLAYALVQGIILGIDDLLSVSPVCGIKGLAFARLLVKSIEGSAPQTSHYQSVSFHTLSPYENPILMR